MMEISWHLALRPWVVSVYMVLVVARYSYRASAATCKTVGIFGTRFQKHVEGFYDQPYESTCSHKPWYRPRDPGTDLEGVTSNHSEDHVYFYSNYWYAGQLICGNGGEIRIYAPNAVSPDQAEGPWWELDPYGNWQVNPNLGVMCQEDSSTSGTSNSSVIYIAIGVTVLVIMLVLGLAFILRRQVMKSTDRRRHHSRRHNHLAPPTERSRRERRSRGRPVDHHSNPMTMHVRSLPQPPPSYTQSPRESESSVYIGTSPTHQKDRPPSYIQALAEGAANPTESFT